jgi:V/A-type H+-transporting ATPase subunit I
MISTLIIVLKEPLGNLIRREDPLFSQGVAEFITEQFFELIETFISMFSNGLSFVRVGAFTLSHVGLFVAFHTLAEMIGGTTGTVSMAFVGNLLIIVLEGLVVFIQGLRLMYYELFSKYFIGEGRLFKALKLEEK